MSMMVDWSVRLRIHWSLFMQLADVLTIMSLLLIYEVVCENIDHKVIFFWHITFSFLSWNIIHRVYGKSLSILKIHISRKPKSSFVIFKKLAWHLSMDTIFNTRFKVTCIDFPTTVLFSYYHSLIKISYFMTLFYSFSWLLLSSLMQLTIISIFA